MAKSMELGMMPNAEGSMNIASAIAFDTAAREYNDAWSGAIEHAFHPNTSGRVGRPLAALSRSR